MRAVYISKYPNPETEFYMVQKRRRKEDEEHVYIMCEFENLMDHIRAAQRMRPYKIIIDYKSFIDDED